MMTPDDEQLAAVELGWDLTVLGRSWRSFMVPGVVLITAGMIALSSQTTVLLATTVVIGGLLLLTGAADVVGAFWSRRWSGFFLHLLSGMLSALVGVLFISAPIDATLTLTLLLSCLMMVMGIFNFITAATYRFQNWGWTLLSGSVDLILSVAIWLAWPASGLRVIGLFLGSSLIFRGFDWVGLAVALRAHSLAFGSARRLNAPGAIFPSPVMPSSAQAGH